MTPNDVIAQRTEGGWEPTNRLGDLWRGARAIQPLQPRFLIAEGSRLPTPLFLGVARKALGLSIQPNAAIIERDGRPTREFLAAAQAVGL